MISRAGREYQEEVRGRRTRQIMETDESIQVIITSRERLPCFAVIHLPIDEHQGKDFKTYQEKMLATLEKGLNQAAELHYKRVVIYTNGIRSGSMLWEEAEATLVALAKLYIHMAGLWGSLRELVIVTTVYNTVRSWGAKPGLGSSLRRCLHLRTGRD